MHAGATSGGGDRWSLAIAISRTANDTVLGTHHAGLNRRVLDKVLRDMHHRDAVEGDETTLALAVVVRVPDLDVALDVVSYVLEGDGDWSSPNTSMTTSRSLKHVARCASIIYTGAVAMLS